MARLVAYGIGAVEPGMFGLGPVPAVKQALDRAGWKVSDIRRIEINEAFAAIVIAVTKDLGHDTNVVNMEGGAIAHGQYPTHGSAVASCREDASFWRAVFKAFGFGALLICKRFEAAYRSPSSERR
jgi:acetyl-CoA C-acetyltransferase